jgi:electron transport complex protein RnfE
MAKENFRFHHITTPLVGGLTKNNPVFRLVLGTCPTLAITTSALNGVTMGIATTFVLLFSNCIISALRNVIPLRARIPVYVMIIASFVTVVQLSMNYLLPDLYESLGIFLPLITVNCIVFGRAESFASSNAVLPSFFDGLGAGLGFTASITVMGMIREFIGAGAVFGKPMPALQDLSMTFFILPAGGFMVFGFLMVIYNQTYAYIQKKKDVAQKTRENKEAEK